jgi:hypothetical protein
VGAGWGLGWQPVPQHTWRSSTELTYTMVAQPQRVDLCNHTPPPPPPHPYARREFSAVERCLNLQGQAVTGSCGVSLGPIHAAKLYQP